MKIMCPIKMEYHKFLRHLPHKKKGKKRGQGVSKLLPNILIQGARSAGLLPYIINVCRQTPCVFSMPHIGKCVKNQLRIFFSTSVGFYLHLVNFIDNAYTKNYIVLQQSTPIYLPGRLLNYPCINIFF